MTAKLVSILLSYVNLLVINISFNISLGTCYINNVIKSRKSAMYIFLLPRTIKKSFGLFNQSASVLFSNRTVCCTFSQAVLRIEPEDVGGFVRSL